MDGTNGMKSLAEAQRLRAALRGQRTVAAEGDAPAALPIEPGALPVVFAMTPARILLLGMFSFSLVWLAAIFGVIQLFDQFIDVL